MREDGAHDEWWLATLGRLLVWARLRIRDSGIAEVFDADGKTLVYDSEDTARAALMDADFVAFDGLDADDALQRGLMLVEIVPPKGEDEHSLRARMTQSLGARA